MSCAGSCCQRHPRACTSGSHAKSTAAGDPAPGWVATCASDLGLHPSRWNNCRNTAEIQRDDEPLRLSTALSAALSALGGPITLIGDSVLRGLFFLMACLILPHVPAPRPRMEGAHFSGPARISSELGVLRFIWADAAAWTSDERQEIRSSAVVLLHFGSHAQNASHALGMLGAIASGMALDTPQAPRTIVWSYMPSHFPSAPDGGGEWHGRTASGQVDMRRVQQYMQPTARCVPHASLGPRCDASCSAMARGNFRRAASLAFAAQHALPILDAWDDAAANFDDHPGPSAASAALMLGRSIDCKHWCAPGRTLMRVLGEFLRQIRNGTAGQGR